MCVSNTQEYETAERKKYFCMLEKPYTEEPPIKDTPNKEHLSIKDKSTRPNSYYTSTF